MTDILTLTLNPALDVLTSIDKVSDTHKMRCGQRSNTRAAAA